MCYLVMSEQMVGAVAVYRKRSVTIILIPVHNNPFHINSIIIMPNLEKYHIRMTVENKQFLKNVNTR